MGTDDDRSSIGRFFANDGVECADPFGVESIQRLIQKDHLRRREQTTNQPETLSHAFRKFGSESIFFSR